MERLTRSIAGHRLELAYRPAPAGAPTLVFLHEGLGSVGLWRDVPERVADATGFGLLAYSRYGNGFSEVLGEPRDVDYMHREALEVLPELLGALDIPEPMLFGHSDGASIALIYASEHPVRALVLEAPHVVVEELSVASIAAIGETYRAGALRERMRRHHANVDATFEGWNRIWLDPAFRAWSLVERLPQVTAPALVIQGARDEYGTLAQVDTIARESGGPVDRLILAHCGHAPHRDRSDLVLATAATWLAKAANP